MLDDFPPDFTLIRIIYSWLQSAAGGNMEPISKTFHFNMTGRFFLFLQMTTNASKTEKFTYIISVTPATTETQWLNMENSRIPENSQNTVSIKL